MVMIILCYSALVLAGEADRMEENLISQYIREEIESKGKN